MDTLDNEENNLSDEAVIELESILHRHFGDNLPPQVSFVFSFQDGEIVDISVLPYEQSGPPQGEGVIYVADTDSLFNTRMQRYIKSRDLHRVREEFKANEKRFNTETMTLLVKAALQSNRSGRLGRPNMKAETVELLTRKNKYMSGLKGKKPVRTKQQMANDEIKKTAGVSPGALRKRKHDLKIEHEKFRNQIAQIMRKEDKQTSLIDPTEK